MNTTHAQQDAGAFQPCAADRRCAAFTLTELLVVIVTLAVLVALVLPALASSRPNGQLFQCLNNQKQLATAWLMYAPDNGGNLVGFNCKNKWDWRLGASTAGGVPAVTAAPPSNLVPGTEAYYDWYMQEGYKEAALYKYATNATIIHCPGDKRLPAGTTYYYDSYSGVAGLCGGGINSATGVQDNSGAVAGATPIMRTSGLKHPANRFLWVEENDVRGDNLGSWELRFSTGGTPPFSSSTWLDCTAVYHGASGTFSFADGHAVGRGWIDAATIRRSQAGNYTMSGGGDDLLYVATGYGCQENP